MIVLLIGVGGAIGSIARYLLGRAVLGALHLEFPTGTFIVNVLGCLAIGLLAKYFMNSQTEAPLRATLMIGFCGGFTTFSSFSLETLGLMRGGELGKAALYVMLSCVLCIGATAAGFAVGRPLNP